MKRSNATSHCRTQLTAMGMYYYRRKFCTNKQQSSSIYSTIVVVIAGINLRTRRKLQIEIYGGRSKAHQGRRRQQAPRPLSHRVI